MQERKKKKKKQKRKRKKGKTLGEQKKMPKEKRILMNQKI